MSVADKKVTAPRAEAHPTESCLPVREILNLVGDKWSILIIRMLSPGTKRFSELQREVDGISQKMLTRTLRDLERYGLVKRTVEPTVPPRVYYALTHLGKTLLEPVAALAGWAVKNYADVQTAKSSFDKRA